MKDDFHFNLRGCLGTLQVVEFYAENDPKYLRKVQTCFLQWSTDPSLWRRLISRAVGIRNINAHPHQPTKVQKILAKNFGKEAKMLRGFQRKYGKAPDFDPALLEDPASTIEQIPVSQAHLCGDFFGMHLA